MKLLKVAIGLLLGVAIWVVAYRTGRIEREWEIILNIVSLGEPGLLSPVTGRPESYFD
jgi:hypothetical protein